MSLPITAMQKLDEFQSLSHDWDSYGADTISPHAIEAAKTLLAFLAESFDDESMQSVEVFPRADGGVQLEWMRPSAELEIFVSPGGGIGSLSVAGSGTGRTYEEKEDISIDAVCTMLARLIQSN